MSQQLTTTCDRCRNDIDEADCVMLRVRAPHGDMIADLCDGCHRDLRGFLTYKPDLHLQ